MLSTSRRKFLATVSAAASAATAGLVSFSPRAPGFLLESAARGADASPRGERILVVVQLSGGNDGLNTVVPYTHEIYKKNRTSLAIGEGAALKIADGIGLHPSLTGMATLLENRQLAILQGVGYPNPNRSHFESMDIWHSARTAAAERTSGWLGRAFDAQASRLAMAADPPALHLGEEVQPLALAARDVPTPSIRSLDQFKLETGGDNSRRALITAAAAAPRSGESNLLKFIQTRETSALEVSRRLESSGQEYKTSVAYPGTGLAEKLKRIAQLIDAGLATRVYYVALDGFDTHSDQAGAHASLLTQVGGALAAFAEDLQLHGQLDRVLTLVFSEFGRRLDENASQGTDHGAAAPVFLVGNRVQPGLIGAHPKLDDLEDGDVKFHTDFRSVYATLLQDWLGWPAEPILGPGFSPASFLRA
jgi:uncharacterized protein (DUF1501 family)